MSDLKVSVAARRYACGVVGIWATVTDRAGDRVEAVCVGTAGQRKLPARWTRSHGTPAVWIVRVRVGARIAIAAETPDGRWGRGTALVEPPAPGVGGRRRNHDRV